MRTTYFIIAVVTRYYFSPVVGIGKEVVESVLVEAVVPSCNFPALVGTGSGEIQAVKLQFVIRTRQNRREESHHIVKNTRLLSPGTPRLTMEFGEYSRLISCISQVSHRRKRKG